MTGNPTAWVFDMDGSLCDVQGISHYVEGAVKNFDAFHAASAFCPSHPWVVQLARQARTDGHAVLVVTGRVEKWRNLTRQWLRAEDVPYDALAMRPDGDFRPDYVVKKEILARLRERWFVVHAVDDNPAVLALWAAEGIPTTVVPGWPDRPRPTGDPA